ncbi:thiamine phosphate synthase [Putridiphycobacter roseus]|uniref:Thiamine-phosphate synthase n=1 Tax=Putridiphycobacter roseus TaxID=2219161 RepID=A0A2W1NKZ3_9FLAO|nr:thiamine phosphate synthase [Putridiphycobacter roseus]PZE16332.1 thiamine phosphate synthase [Putridiphycobacter roseus]
MNKLTKIYYISQGKSTANHLLNIEKVCRSGCKLIQLRLKNLPLTEVLITVQKALEICNKFNALLIINDYSNIVEQIPTTGLHLGQKDGKISDVRNNLSDSIIGGTANTLEDCIQLYKEGADYIGLGPLRFTPTKTNLDPILGYNGYKEIIHKLDILKIKIPIYAIGGIVENDIQPLLDMGLHGVAISSLLTQQTIEQNKKLIKEYE